MSISSQQKNKLKEILLNIGDSADREEMSVLESSDLNQHLSQSQRDLKAMFSQMQAENRQYLKDIQRTLLEGLKGLAVAIKDTRQQDYSGFFKDFPTLLADIGGNTKNTSELIRNLKWNASQQLRDVNGSPINPAIAGFGITATYDDIELGYTGSNLTSVIYKQAGQIKAVLSLMYDGSDNLIEVQRTA